MKVVPKRGVCFATRLDKETTEGDLKTYLTDVGIKDVLCKKNETKGGPDILYSCLSGLMLLRG